MLYKGVSLDDVLVGHPGFWIIKCKGCNEEFTSFQFNYKYLPEICKKCKISHHPCPSCGKMLGYYKLYCNSRCANRDKNNVVMQLGHFLQGEKIKGEKNPAKRKDVRLKISKGVRESYIKYPDLLSLRSFQVKKNVLLRSNQELVDEFGNSLKSKLELEIANFLKKHGIKYEYEKAIKLENGHTIFPDFLVYPKILIEVCGWFALGKRSLVSYINRVSVILKETDVDLVVVTYKEYVSFFNNLKSIRSFDVVSLTNYEPLVSLEIDDVLKIDYAHVLPKDKSKCSFIHAHSSYKINVKIFGITDYETKMLFEMKELKDIVKKVISQIDHKLVVSSDYIVSKLKDNFIVEYKNINGDHQLNLPENEVFVLDCEPTVEAIAEKFAEEILVLLPPNVLEIELTFSEGLDKFFNISKFRKYYRIYVLEDLEKLVGYHIMLNLYNEYVKLGLDKLGGMKLY